MSGEISCLECDGVMTVTREARRYGRGVNVVLDDIEVRRCPSCGEEEVVIPRIEEVHDQIARAIVAKDGVLSAGEIRFLRTHMGYSGRDFAKVMGVSPETVSRWERENAPQAMGGPAEKLLRLVVLVGEPLLRDVLAARSELSGGFLRFRETEGQWLSAAATAAHHSLAS